MNVYEWMDGWMNVNEYEWNERVDEMRREEMKNNNTK